MNIITFFRHLKESDWEIPVTKKWKIKDVLSHLIGWERECARELVRVFETGIEPWFMLTDTYDDFNEKIYREFIYYSPKTLIAELEKWNAVLKNNIQKIGEEKIRHRPYMDWVFDEGDESHFEHHLKQIREVLKKRIKNSCRSGKKYKILKKQI